MQKVILKVYIHGRIRPLIVCDIVNNVEETIKDFVAQLNNKDLHSVQLGTVGFNRADYHYHTYEYK